MIVYCHSYMFCLLLVLTSIVYVVLHECIALLMLTRVYICTGIPKAREHYTHTISLLQYAITHLSSSSAPLKKGTGDGSSSHLTSLLHRLLHSVASEAAADGHELGQAASSKVQVTAPLAS